MIGFIGGGYMAEALIRGLCAGDTPLMVSEPKPERREYLSQKYSIQSTVSNIEVVTSSSIVIIAVKPQIIHSVLDEIAAHIRANQIIISVAAGITITTISKKLGTDRVVRVMPNTPSLVQQGMSVLALGKAISGPDAATVLNIFGSVGSATIMKEELINSVTAVSGSGPAFVALFTEAMIDAGVKLGIEREKASELAIQTLIGTAALMETGMCPEALRKMVTSPGGTTAAGIKAFEEQGLSKIVATALTAAHDRAVELSQH